MRVKLEDLSPEKRRAVQDFKNDITGVFDELYEDKWNQKRWDDAMKNYKATHDTWLLMKTIGSKERTPDEFWAARQKEFQKGPPTFVRPGWKSPLVGKALNLEWLDDLQNGRHFKWIKGQDEWEDGWRDKKLAVFEFWTSWCTPCLRAFRQFSNLAETYDASVLMAGINSEEVFSNDPIDTAAVYSFVQKRGDMNYPIVIDVDRVAVKALLDAAGRRAVPTVIIISIKDRIVHFVGDPGDVDGAVDKILAMY